MGIKKSNKGFICEHCGKKVLPLNNGSYRNHCPYCLYSKHVDNVPGDRMNDCEGLMKPIGIKYNSGKGYQIIQQCLKCGTTKVNIIAEDTTQPDEIDQIIKFV